MRRDPEFFEAKHGNPKIEQRDAPRDLDAAQDGEADPNDELELPLLYLSKRLREALKIEELLTANNIDYLVEAGPYLGGLLFRRQLTGAYFYVADKDIAQSRRLLKESGYKPFEENNSSDGRS